MRPLQHFFWNVILPNGLTSAYRRNQLSVEFCEEQDSTDMIVERITQSIGEPKLNPDRLTADSHSQHVEGKPLLDSIRYLGDDDSISRIMMEKTLTRRKSMPTT